MWLSPNSPNLSSKNKVYFLLFFPNFWKYWWEIFVFCGERFFFWQKGQNNFFFKTCLFGETLFITFLTSFFNVFDDTFFRLWQIFFFYVCDETFFLCFSLKFFLLTFLTKLFFFTFLTKLLFFWQNFSSIHSLALPGSTLATPVALICSKGRTNTHAVKHTLAQLYYR